jgi:hypothetical protein
MNLYDTVIVLSRMNQIKLKYKEKAKAKEIEERME